MSMNDSTQFRGMPIALASLSTYQTQPPTITASRKLGMPPAIH